jgi:hypothetical protein
MFMKGMCSLLLIENFYSEWSFVGKGYIIWLLVFFHCRWGFIALLPFLSSNLSFIYTLYSAKWKQWSKRPRHCIIVARLVFPTWGFVLLYFIYTSKLAGWVRPHGSSLRPITIGRWQKRLPGVAKILPICHMITEGTNPGLNPWRRWVSPLTWLISTHRAGWATRG